MHLYVLILNLYFDVDFSDVFFVAQDDAFVFYFCFPQTISFMIKSPIDQKLKVDG